jgi:HEAT repeat protein
MATRTAPVVSSIILFGICAAPAAAQQPPRIINGRVTTQAAASPLADGVRTLAGSRTEPAWIGYSVPVVAGERRMCCGGDGSTYISGSVVMVDGQVWSPCRLEPRTDNTQTSRGNTAPSTPAAPVQLEAPDQVAVLLRVADRRVERIRVFSPDCELDAGGREVIWLQNVRPAESIAMLESLATTDAAERRDRVVDGAVSAIALHRDTAADAALERFVAPTQPVSLRRKVTFWLGNARGARGLALLQRIVRDDPSTEVRKGAVFGVSQSREPGAFDALATLARSDASSVIRSEAVFWIAQENHPRSPAVILEALEKDSSVQVQKKAVFALSQLGDNAGVDPLIQAARGHQDASVRSEAIFWLGQKAGAKAAAEITNLIENDPDTEVKKKAVFALSQFPRDEGVPMLIQVAKTNSNPAVRKQAMFWLAQSRDPRAIDFFAQILK